MLLSSLDIPTRTLSRKDILKIATNRTGAHKRPRWLRPPHSLSYTELTSRSELAPLQDALQQLATNASESNVYFEPWLLLPALKHFLSEENTSFVVIEEKNRSSNERSLIGFFPLIQKSKFRVLPFSHLATLAFSHCGYLTPLIRKGREKEAFSLFLRYLDEKHSFSFVELSHMIGEGELHQTLLSLLKQRPRASFISESYSRSLVTKCLPKGDFLSSLTRKKRKDLLRKERQLAGQGKLKCEILTHKEELQSWIDQFLTLEQSGWKGREGTAIALHLSEKQYFSKILGSAYSNNQLLFIRLTLNEQPIAMRCGLVAGDTLFSYKIAFDEAYAKYSPGVLLEIENIDYLSKREDICCMDSCAIPSHSMFERLWPEQRQLSSVVMSSQGRLSRILVRALDIAQRGFRWVKALSKG